MAKVIGESEAWKYVANSMASLGFEVADVSAISAILADQRSKLEVEENKREELLQEENQIFSQKIEKLNDEYQKVLTTAKEKSLASEGEFSGRIKTLEKPVSFFKKISIFSKI